jgi:alpha/beta hydrolase family protein DUF900
MANALSIRPRTPAETPCADEVYQAGGSRLDLASARRLVILIHGFNNSEASARKSFESFRKLVGSTIPRQELWDFHWPGDHPTRLISLATYGIRVGIAPQVGTKLGEFLSARAAVQSVCIVAHSLGCRVALEAVRAISSTAENSRAPVHHVFLLAAAVPVPLCDGNASRFPRPLANSHEHVFHSRRDIVLRWSFRRGQSFIGTNEKGPAVGRDGDPGPRRWTDPVDTKLRHGQYWGSKPVSWEILRRLGIPTVRTVPARYLPADEIDSAQRTLERLYVSERELPER